MSNLGYINREMGIRIALIASLMRHLRNGVKYMELFL